MDDGARIARVTALMAAHGYILAKMIDFMLVDPKARMGIAAFGIGPALGLLFAYLTLWRRASNEWGRRMEIFSALILGGMIVGWITKPFMP